MRRAADEPGLVVLAGDWFGAETLLASRPVRTTVELADLDDGGRWIGAVDYDGAARFACYDHVLTRRDGQWWFDGAPTALERWRELLAGPARTVAGELGAPELPSRTGHLAAVERAVELIRAGELYQVNVCTRMGGAFAGNPAGLFADLIEQLEPARAALVASSDRTLVSASPELFLGVADGAVRTSPIKGTLPRSDADDGNAARLRASVKDAAENVMIVDLMRNDLGRVCATGSVRVEALLDVAPHPGVWHLVSTVTARLRPKIGVAALLAATLPPGSVTGAPKLRAVDLIAELEHAPRGAYTGAVGAVLPGAAEFAVTIRSFEIADGRWKLGVGGGVTADSVPMTEWHEVRHKAAPLLAVAGLVLPPEPLPPAPADTGLLETLLAVDGHVLRLADHLARLDRSARELTGRGVPPTLRDEVRDAAYGLARGRGVVRVVLRDGVATVTAAPLGPPPVASELTTVVRPDGLWRHKWADRAALAVPVPVGEPLFVAADGTVLETVRGNVFLVLADGTLVTAPLRDDLLPGVTRRAVLDLARDTGRRTEVREFDRAELQDHAAFWTSSLSGAVPIRRVDGHLLPTADEVVTPLAAALFDTARSGR